METLHPGLYKQEVSGASPVEGVSTSTAGFVGTAPRGVVGVPFLVTSWTQFVNEFGSYSNDSYLAYAVRGFFENGGKRAYIVRTVHYASGVKTSASASIAIGTNVASIKAINDGVWGNDIAVELTAGSGAGLANLNVYYQGSVVEKYEDLSVDNAEDSLVDSKYITLTMLGTTALPATAKTNLAGGNDGLVGIADTDFTGDPANKTGLYAFNGVAVNLVAVPGMTTTAVLKGVISYADGRGDCFGILDVPKGLKPTQAQTYVVSTANLASEYAGAYYPWLSVSDPIGVGKNPSKLVPPSGHIAGAFANMDSIGVWRAPAGTDSVLQGVLDVEYNVSDEEQDILNPYCINCIRSFAGDGIVVWGARTLSKGEYKYIPVRRLMMYIESSLMSGLRWTVFKPNDTDLWNASKGAVEAFLGGIWSSKGLKGSSTKEAFFVVCDSTNNTSDTVDEGKMFIDIGIAPLKPAEFVIFRIGLKR